MSSSKSHWRTAWKVIECVGAMLFIAWLLYPYPYTWDQLGEKYPGTQYGVFIPVMIYLWLQLGHESKQVQERPPKIADKDSSNGAS